MACVRFAGEMIAWVIWCWKSWINISGIEENTRRWGGFRTAEKRYVLRGISDREPLIPFDFGLNLDAP